ncbi:MAG: HIT family protein [Aurantimonas endophytica]|uniref:Histidine triad (HIT) family protein n=1 Tax=Aurantimonas endophytica TaxID=1522175 RepID=A0A7W6HA70_9HYPH|nr:HIT family protein [Aurantimonas endophytica]MBB4001465.1 histidine triad (HIT) family protein [Aurantimonas endophytica]MCO6402894.1 HIT domain-containing protein [Aurantimonas endophytica]
MTSYDDGNIFAKILRGEIPSLKLYEDDTAMAIMDIMPQSKGHCLVIPKAPSRNLLDADDSTLAAVMPIVGRLARAVRRAFGADGVQVAQFNEEPAGQTVFHLHFHVVPVYAGVPVARHGGGSAPQAELEEQAEQIRAALA